jgi:colanic acid/amylovoran biosynthesis glycosyltransferase
MTWVYGQIKFAQGVRSLVFADRVTDLEHFPWQPVFEPSSWFDRSIQGMRAQALARSLGASPRSRAYSAVIRREAPIALLSHFGTRAWADMSLCSAHRLPHLVRFYGSDISQLPRKPHWTERYRRLFDEAAGFLCEGPFMARTVVELGCPAEKVHVQPLGIDLETIDYRPREPASDGSLRILLASTFTPKKGIPYGLEAIGLLVRSGCPVSATIIGDADANAQRQAEKRLILDTLREQGLERHVELRGLVRYDELLTEAYAHDVFLAPSVTAADGDTEGGAPVVIIEMAASGMPVVATTHCDIPSVVLDGVTGLLAAERDPEGLAERLKTLADSPEMRGAMGMAARRHIEASFDVRLLSESLEAHYLAVRWGGE